MTKLTSRARTLPLDLQAAAHNLLAIQADLASITCDLRYQATLLDDRAAAAELESSVELYEQFPPLLAAIRDLIERHRS